MASPNTGSWPISLILIPDLTLQHVARLAIIPTVALYNDMPPLTFLRFYKFEMLVSSGFHDYNVYLLL